MIIDKYFPLESNKITFDELLTDKGNEAPSDVFAPKGKEKGIVDCEEIHQGGLRFAGLAIDGV